MLFFFSIAAMRLLLPLLMVGFKEAEKLDGNGNEKIRGEA